MKKEILKIAYTECWRVAFLDAGYDTITAESMSADLVEKMVSKTNPFAPHENAADTKKKKKTK